ncbi:uncharacterized protein EV422DRAFT_309554 [Fimicolochytrium jonesii]|uniref:uncharacterized protein n=1 Tax=Fimicolochytrium jonesii TaxID=1396493 RepID=UPI0022FEE136|nr:uncharacterized protein EV422DRAFT_309554 [Fimicolochytrium jonesii]KAI8824156.1 hypothetical protein EV422DRAFT_309554 [Fimicolochytrium jonesii]
MTISQFAVSIADTILNLSNRAFDLAISTVLAVEVAVNDTTIWLPDRQRTWLDHYYIAFQNDHNQLMMDKAGSPSLLSFGAVNSLLSVGGMCFAKNGCDNREYNETFGFTQDLVEGPFETLIFKWRESLSQYLLSNPVDQNLNHKGLRLMQAVLEDCANGSAAINDLLVADINERNKQARALTILAFSVAVAAFALGYMIVPRRLIRKFKEQMDSCLWLVFALPPEVTNTLPDLKRFIESGGAILPGQTSDT